MDNNYSLAIARTEVSGQEPLQTDVFSGELVANIPDGRLWIGQSTGPPVELTSRTLQSNDVQAGTVILDLNGSFYNISIIDNYILVPPSIGITSQTLFYLDSATANGGATIDVGVGSPYSIVNPTDLTPIVAQDMVFRAIVLPTRDILIERLF